MLAVDTVFIITWIMAVLLVAAIVWRANTMKRAPVETPIPLRMIPGEPSKCFDCESSLPPALKYLGQPSKCFDCERGPAPQYEHPVKVFSAETPLFTSSPYRSSAPF
jgi:hypothetical protein